MKRYFRLIFAVIIFSVLPASIFSIGGISNKENWKDCPKVKNSEIVSAVLGEKNSIKPRPECVSNGVIRIKTESGFTAELAPNSKRWFKAFDIYDADADSALSTFRILEIILIEKIGTPVSFNKQGTNISARTSLLLMKRGRIEYRTIWQYNNKKIVLLLSGKDLSLIISLYEE